MIQFRHRVPVRYVSMFLLVSTYSTTTQIGTAGFEPATDVINPLLWPSELRSDRQFKVNRQTTHPAFWPEPPEQADSSLGKRIVCSLPRAGVDGIEPSNTD